MESPSRILLIRPSALGDVCRSVPVLASLRARFPAARIDWLVRDSFVGAVADHPALSAVIPFERKRIAIGRLWRRDGRAALAGFLRELARAGYDHVYDCQGLGRSGFFAWATGSTRRVGFRDARELGWLGLTDRIDVPRGMHTVDRMLALIEGAGVPAVRDMRLYTSPRDRSSLDPRLAGHRYAVIAPTSAWAGKRWPADRFASVARELLARDGDLRIAVVGGPGERDQCGALVDAAREDPRVIDLVGATSVGGLMAVIERSALVVANDSAAVHMAVGFDRPLVALYGPTRVDLVGPYRREADVIQAAAPHGGNEHKDDAAGRAAMERISADRVSAACIERLKLAPPPPASHGARP